MPTSTILPTSTLTPTVSPSPTTTLTPTPLLEELSNQILETYRMIAMIQFNAELLNETAGEVKSIELSGFAEALVIMVLANLVDAVEQNIPEISPPDALKTYWDSSRQVHDQTKDILKRWLGIKIMSGNVLVELEPV